MSAPHGCTDDTAVVESFKEALIGRVGTDRYQMWFAHGVDFAIDDVGVDGADVDEASIDDQPTAGDAAAECRSRLVLSVRGQFALDRLRKNFLREIRGAALQACGSSMDVQLCLDEPPAAQAELPLSDPADVGRPGDQDVGPTGKSPRQRRASEDQRRRRARGKPKSLSTLIGAGAGKVRDQASRSGSTAASSQQLELPQFAADAGATTVAEETPRGGSDTAPRKATSRPAMNAANFVTGISNRLAHTAMIMVCQDPTAASPLFMCGPTGTGKTHLMSAIADQLRRHHRMRRVMHLSAEQFTNDFISSVGNSGITAFRRRYREVDALLIDDVQFLGAKKATLREMLYTVETLASAGRPLVFSGLHSPTEIQGLSRELAGRLAAGLVCPVQPLDLATRDVILRRWIEQRCSIPVPDQMIEQIGAALAGDGRVISGVVNMINTLQRMNGRNPTMDELHRFGGELLRAAKPVATLSVIEMAVCEAFHLPPDTLRSGMQTRAVTGPRMLAMYLSRRLTSSAYAEIASHFGGKSHSTAISAENNVKAWLESGKPIGRGVTAMSAQDAIERVEGLLRSG